MNFLKKFFKNSGVFISEAMAIRLVFISGFLFLIILVLIIWAIYPKVKVKIDISGPVQAKVGELVVYKVRVKNKGNVILKNPELIFNYPLKSLPEKGELIEVISSEKFGNFLYPKEEKVFEFKTYLFGIEGEQEEIKSWLNYSWKTRIERSPVATFSIKISEVPIDLELDVPKIPISSKAENKFKFKVRYISFVELPNLRLRINLPQQFIFKGSRPEREGEYWETKKLEKNKTNEVEVWGEFTRETEIGKELDFSAQILILLHGEEVLLKKAEKKSLTFEPTFLISQKINNKEDYIPSPGERLHYQIHFKNMSEKSFKDLTLISVLEGNLYDLFSLECPGGECKPGDNSITWNGEKINELRYLPPGEEGDVEFWIKLKTDYLPKDLSETNPTLKNIVSLAGFKEEFENKVNTKIEIYQEGYFKDKYGFFENSGHPPVVNQPASYTIVWKVKNYYNSLKNVEVKALLPPGVNVKSIKLPAKGEIKTSGEYLEKILYPEIPTDFRFERNLYPGMKSEETYYLQVILKKEVPTAFPPNVKITGYFGNITFEAVKEFQEKYFREILSPQNLEKGTGYVDELTRTKLNELLAKGVPTAKEIVWEIEEIEAGEGIFTEPLIVAFQIIFIPNSSQRGKVAKLIGEVKLSGRDFWTGEIIFSIDKSIDTTLPDDPLAGKEGKVL